MKDKLILDDLLIISCKEDYTVCLQFLEKGTIWSLIITLFLYIDASFMTPKQHVTLAFLSTGAFIYDSELLLNGIVIQKLEYERSVKYNNVLIYEFEIIIFI